MSVSLDKVVPFGRSRQEYELMFSLTEADRRQRILGCGDGPASFNAEMTAAGYSVVSIDPIYQFTGAQIQQRFIDSLDEVIDQVKATPDRWVWTFHRDSDDLRQNRCRVIELFLADYEQGLNQGRYQIGELPQLPFQDNEFDLALCSHFLFLYSALFSETFHIDAVLELCRVAPEVRIFPILTLAQEPSPYLEAVRAAAAAVDIQSAIEPVEYELQKGGNQMLRLFRAL